jgi:choline-sulfatase
MKKNPNILFIMADQLTASVLPAYGHHLVKTPNLDRIALGGTVFENAYTPNPICASSRFAMMSGQYSSRIGIGTTLTFVSTDVRFFGLFSSDSVSIFFLFGKSSS